RVGEGLGSLGHPVGVVVLPRHGVVRHLGGAGIAAAFGVHAAGAEEAHEAVDLLGMGARQPVLVVPPVGYGRVHGQLQVVEAAVGAGGAVLDHAVLEPAPVQVEGGLEVGLAEEGGAVAVVVQGGGDARGVGRQG